ncbi:MAG: PEGA domain-containing protein [Fibromonadaceae bacterium]|jgi:hypothetical protein|nr:PEGA domain-containing protein [Fibromonadaceae bacterium]
MNRIYLFLILSTLSFAAGPAKPPHPATTETKKPFNLQELSTKDSTATFEIYSRRITLVQDSILATKKEIENVKKKTAKEIPLKPKGEYEKQAEFDARKVKWEKEIDEKALQNSKPLTDRLAELEKAKKQIEEYQTALYCTLEIKTSPEAASIYLNKEEIGASPAEYNLALPGYAVIRIQKENYDPWDTTLTLQPAQKLKLNIALQEKSIFSSEGEINFAKTLAKDTTVNGYHHRINRVNARLAQIESEIRVIFANFPNTYPALEPIKPEETLQDFERRRNSWQYEGERQANALKQKYDAYKAKLVRSVETLKDNIVTTEAYSITEVRPNAQITLGNYDADKELFEIDVQDTADAKSPFHFVGKVSIPTDTAKVMNRSTEGFLAGITYLNYPFISGDSSYNLAMKYLSLERKNMALNVDGTFKNIGKFEAMEGYGPWSIHKDSLLSGLLKPQGLDLNYALKGERPKIAVAEATNATGETKSSGGLGWRGWTRIITFSAMASAGTFAVLSHLKADKNKKDFDKLKNEEPNNPNKNDYTEWYNKLDGHKKDTEENEKLRTIFGAGAGGFAFIGLITFIF